MTLYTIGPIQYAGHPFSLQVYLTAYKGDGNDSHLITQLIGISQDMVDWCKETFPGMRVAHSGEDSPTGFAIWEDVWGENTFHFQTADQAMLFKLRWAP